MLLLGIDPGTHQSGWVLYEPTSDTPIVNSGITDNDKLIATWFECETERFVDQIAIEMIQCMGMPIGETTLETCVWIGEFRQYFKRNNVPVTLIPRGKIKMHLCGSQRAKDKNIRQVLLDRFGPPGTKKAKGHLYGVSGHMLSALAVAVVFADTHLDIPKK